MHMKMNNLDVEDAIRKRRTIRRFKQDPIPLDTLKKLIDLARVAPMAKNIQALEFIIVREKENVKELFKMVKFASSLPESLRTPEKGREPTTYIIVLVNTKIKAGYIDFDVGAAVENILLGAVKYEIGTCWMGNINVSKIRSFFQIEDYYEIKHVISLGYPDEESKVEQFEGSFKYWKDEKGMHVPKRALQEVILKIM
jgi:nitroreductase